MKDIIGISLRRALELPKIKDVKLLAGKNLIDRKIVKINIMEVPDIVDWVEEGELLFTTLYSIKDDEEALRNLIPKLAEKKLTGLGIKPGRYINEIPEFMIEQAQKHKLPLLQVPYDYSFSELINAILKEIINVQTKFLEKTLNIHQDLTGIALSRGGLDELIKRLKTRINNPVIIVDDKGKKLVSSLPHQLKKYKEEDFIHKIEENFPENYNPEGQDESLEQKNVKIKGEQIKQYRLPIISRNNLFGFLYTWEVSSGFNLLDINTLKWATTIAALDILNKRELAEVERRYKNELLYDIVKGKINSRETMLQRSRHMGMNLAGGHMVVLFDTKDLVNKYMMEDNLPHRRNVQKDVFSVVKNNGDSEVVAGLLGAYILVLFPLKERDFTQNKEKIKEYLARTRTQMPDDYINLLKIGIGNYAADVTEIPESYHQAKKAIYVADKFNKNDNNTFFYNELGIYKLLYKINNEELENFIKNILSPLVEYDREHNTELLETLESYFEEKGNLTSVSKKLYIHYNTAVYRMERIEAITGLDLDNPDDRLNLEIALKLYKLNK
ncbi:MAG: PucR family transcriptional regulator [Halanaerobiales bacterium]